MENKYCIFLYSHFDYSDVWGLTFGQIKKYINLNEVTLYFCVNQIGDYKLDERIKVIYYDDSLCYSDRVLYNIKDLSYEYVLFLHEDWVITNTYNNNHIIELVNFMKQNDILHVRSYKSYGDGTENNIQPTNNLNLRRIPRDAGYFISLQPGLWTIQTLISLFSFKSQRPNLLEIVSNSNNIFKNHLTDKFLYENIRPAEDSVLFPHIHSIAYGKWAISNDSYKKFDLLFKEYNINPNIRGTL
jgi:hypothetical protein